MDKEKKGEEPDFRKEKKISKIFDQPGTRFVLLPAGQKSPPDREKWQKNPYSFQEVQEQRDGRNVGLIASEDCIILDVDDPSALSGLDLPKSTKWETRTEAERYAT